MIVLWLSVGFQGDPQIGLSWWEGRKTLSQICTFGVVFPVCDVCVHTEKSFRNLIKLNRSKIVFTISRLIWNSKWTSVCFQINCCIVNTIWFGFDLLRLLLYFSTCNWLLQVCRRCVIAPVGHSAGNSKNSRKIFMRRIFLEMQRVLKIRVGT